MTRPVSGASSPRQRRKPSEHATTRQTALCPYCGSNDQTIMGVEARLIYRVECDCCSTHGPYQHTDAEAVAAWNAQIRMQDQRESWRCALCGECAWRGPEWQPRQPDGIVLAECRRISWDAAGLGVVLLDWAACPAFVRRAERRKRDEDQTSA